MDIRDTSCAMSGLTARCRVDNPSLTAPAFSAVMDFRSWKMRRFVIHSNHGSDFPQLTDQAIPIELRMRVVFCQILKEVSIPVNADRARDRDLCVTHKRLPDKWREHRFPF